MNRLAVLEKPRIAHRIGVNLPTPLPVRDNGDEHPFVKELIRQFRLQDAGGNYHGDSNESLLQSWVTPSKRQGAKNAKIDRCSQLRVSAFYHAIATFIERETGQLTRIFLNLSHQGASSALICCGNLLVMNELLPKIHGFGFDSIDKLVTEAEKLIDSAVTRIHQFY
jgi:probable nitrogen fixation protein